ncbi:hypothetical protein HK100_001988 [Physocladia obscura]|uniref:Chalcone isomerase domain-containing protein n=1 Tax=Physocladia obscura TaxID=109957 RepID=A0AAD5XJL2_9FUNG|nr:hypothetical protein HK100_001988 [Physocladia obscura]
MIRRMFGKVLFGTRIALTDVTGRGIMQRRIVGVLGFGIGIGAGLSFVSANSIGILTLEAEWPVLTSASFAASYSDVDVFTDPDTSVLIPYSLSQRFAGRIHNFSLLGFGVRAVTVLNFHVYVAALYADAAAVAALKSDSRWKSFKPADLLSSTDSGFHMKSLVRHSNTELALIIEPVRQTTGVHLRQGFTRFLNARLAKDVRENNFPSSADQAEAEKAIADLERLFPVGTINKNERILFTKTADSCLRLEYQENGMQGTSSKHLAIRVLSWQLNQYIKNHTKFTYQAMLPLPSFKSFNLKGSSSRSGLMKFSVDKEKFNKNYEIEKKVRFSNRFFQIALSAINYYFLGEMVSSLINSHEGLSQTNFAPFIITNWTSTKILALELLLDLTATVFWIGCFASEVQLMGGDCPPNTGKGCDIFNWSLAWNILSAISWAVAVGLDVQSLAKGLGFLNYGDPIADMELDQTIKRMGRV